MILQDDAKGLVSVSSEWDHWADWAATEMKKGSI